MTTSDNIRAMIQSVRDERTTLHTRDETLKEREATLLAWLKEEGASGMQADLPINGNLNTLGTFLVTTLAPGKRITAADLGEMASAEGLIEKDARPGRVAHGALMGLQNQGYVKRNDDGTWSKQ